MKKILSTTGEPIEFAITSDRKVTIDPVEPIEVSEEDFAILDSRLGAQISVVPSEETEEEEVASNGPGSTATSEEKTPILKNYKVIAEAGIQLPNPANIDEPTEVAQGEDVELDALDENTITLLTSGSIEEVTPEV